MKKILAILCVASSVFAGDARHSTFVTGGSVQVTDGTNNAAVKAANTPVTAADPALVVAISPNNVISVATAPANATTGFVAGHVVTASTALRAIRATAYNEQTTNAQRSMSSSSANDTSAGTGARQVTITYYDSTGAGPSTEVVTMNGTTAVNTVSTTICFIESLKVTSVGSGGANAGTITLFVGTAGAGGTIGTIGVATLAGSVGGDNQTLWAHHYVPSGKTSSVASLSIGNNSTVVGGGATFLLKAQAIPFANNVELLISDLPRIFGQSSYIPRTYPTPLKVVGPAKITLYVQPESASSLDQHGAFDFFDQ